MTAVYDYLTLTLRRGRPAWQAFADRALTAGASAIAAEGGDLVGVFAPQLGFASDEAVVLVRWPEGARGDPAAISGAPEVVRTTRDLLAPTVRPVAGQALRSGGIYVHRWFMVDVDRVADFVDLSRRAWGGFEGAYQTEIFGLFTAAPSAEDQAVGQGRLLLLTWYADHGVWEASREQTVDPDGLFVKRHALTRSTIGRSSLRVAAS